MRTANVFVRHGSLFAPLLGLLLVAGALAGCNGQQSPSYAEQGTLDSSWQEGADRPPTPQTLTSMARILAAQGKDGQARFVLEKVIQDNPTCTAAYVDLAELCMRQRQTDTAVQVLSRGLKQSPNDPVLMNDLGMCWIVESNYVKAEQMFQQAAAAAPNDARYRANLALAVGMAGRYDEAINLYQQVLSPIDAHYNLAVIADARGDKERATQERQIVTQLSQPPPAETPQGQEPPKAPEGKSGS